MSETEIAGTQTRTKGNTVEGTQYAYYQANNNATSRIKQNSGSNDDYWLRSAYSWSGPFSDFDFVDSDGDVYYCSESYLGYGVSVCFCI